MVNIDENTQGNLYEKYITKGINDPYNKFQNTKGISNQTKSIYKDIIDEKMLKIEQGIQTSKRHAEEMKIKGDDLKAQGSGFKRNNYGSSLVYNNNNNNNHNHTIKFQIPTRFL
jgi:hypothetical protein